MFTLDKAGFVAFQKQWYGCSVEEAKAKWKSAVPSLYVHRCSEILHEHSSGTEERTKTKTRNVDKMTAKQQLSDRGES